MSEEIKSISKIIRPILKKYNVKKAGIFGSYSRGSQNKKSDVDILVEIGEEADLLDLIRLKMTLEKNLKKSVDLVEYDLIREELREKILDEEVSVII